LSIKQFSILTTVFTVLFSLIIIGFNYKTNPYSYFNANYEDGYDLTGYWRLVKPQWYKQQKYDAVIIGSSRSQSGFNPETYEKVTDKKIYNLGLPGMGYYEAYKAVEYVIKEKNYNDSLEIILALDTYLMPLTQETVSSKNVTWLPKKSGFFGKLENKIEFYAKMLFSTNVISKSWDEVKSDKKASDTNLAQAEKLKGEVKELQEKLSKTRDQVKNLRSKADDSNNKDTKRLIKKKLNTIQKWDSILVLKNNKIKQKKVKKGKMLNWQKNGFSRIGFKSFDSKKLQKDFKKWRKRKKILFSDEKLEYFEKTIDLVIANPNVKLTMIHLPMHNYVQSLFMDMGGDFQKESKKEMAKVFIEKKKTCDRIKFYDYFNTNELNSSYLTDSKKSKNYRDLSHMKASYGDIILRDIYEGDRFKSAYGKELKTLGGFNKYLEADELALKAWKSNATELYSKKTNLETEEDEEIEDEEDEGLEI